MTSCNTQPGSSCLLLTPFYPEENGGSERVSAMSQVTQLNLRLEMSSLVSDSRQEVLMATEYSEHGILSKRFLSAGTWAESHANYESSWAVSLRSVPSRKISELKGTGLVKPGFLEREHWADSRAHQGVLVSFQTSRRPHFNWFLPNLLLSCMSLRTIQNKMLLSIWPLCQMSPRYWPSVHWILVFPSWIYIYSPISLSH